MDKSWMTMGKTPDGRLSHPYIEGVNAFINFARAVVDLSSVITFFDALFETNCIILHLKIYICFLQLIH